MSTHDLRKKCPRCKKLRRFYEPPSDCGGERISRKKWRKVGSRWVCVFCVDRHGLTVDS